MSGKIKDISGKRFGRLVAIGFSHKDKGHYFWKFRCDCGKEVAIEKTSVVLGRTKSCGCYNKSFHSKEKIRIKRGDVFGKLTVLEYAHTKNNEKYYKCVCSCGNCCIKRKKYLLYAPTCSCGCLKLESLRKNQLKNCKKHGLSKTKLYRRWCNIKNRCYDTKNIEYFSYGGRGISMCDEWKNNFKSFYDWSVLNGWDENCSRKLCSIDRINPNGNYEPSNCRWTTMKVQNNNRRNNHLITIGNETKTLSLWLNVYNISRDTFFRRKKLGMSDENALKMPRDESKVRC